MRKRSMRVVAAAGFVALAAIALALAWAGGGRAASGNICSTPTTGAPPTASQATCVVVHAAPFFVSPNQDAVATTKFISQTGPSGATATHLVLTVSFPSAVTVDAVSLTVNGANADIKACTETGNVTTVSCPVGNLAGGGVARLAVEFVSASGFSACTHGAPDSTVCISGTASYGEGPGNPSNVPNDFQVGYDYDAVNVDNTGLAGGGCFSTKQIGVHGGNGAQQTQASLGQGNDGLPCTFADAGVNTNQPFGQGHTQISFAQFPPMPNNGFATVTLLFTPLPGNLHWNTFPLYEQDPSTGLFTIRVPNCATSTSPPVAPADSCISSRSTLPKGGAKIVLNVTGSPLDGSWAG